MWPYSIVGIRGIYATKAPLSQRHGAGPLLPHHSALPSPVQSLPSLRCTRVVVHYLQLRCTRVVVHYLQLRCTPVSLYVCTSVVRLSPVTSRPPQEALTSVAVRSLEAAELGGPGVVRALAGVCVAIHTGVLRAAERFYAELRRRWVGRCLLSRPFSLAFGSLLSEPAAK